MTHADTHQHACGWLPHQKLAFIQTTRTPCLSCLPPKQWSALHAKSSSCLSPAASPTVGRGVAAGVAAGVTFGAEVATGDGEATAGLVTAAGDGLVTAAGEGLVTAAGEGDVTAAGLGLVTVAGLVTAAGLGLVTAAPAQVGGKGLQATAERRHWLGAQA